MAPPAGSGNGTGNKSSVRERGHRICTSLKQGNRVLQPVFYSSKEGWRFASHFRSSSSERIMQLKFKMLTLRQIVSQIKSEDFFCHDRSQGRILSHILPSMSQEVPEVHFWGQSIPVSSSSVQPSIITKCVYAALVLLRLQGIRIMKYIDDWLILAQSHQLAPRCRSCPHEKIGVMAKRQEKCAFSITEDHFPGHDM